MEESPAFQKMKEEGTHSKAPLSEAFGQWKNAKIRPDRPVRPRRRPGRGLVHGPVLRAVLPAGIVLKVDGFTANMLIAWSLVLGTGGFVIFGWLSDKIGRKPIILAAACWRRSPTSRCSSS